MKILSNLVEIELENIQMYRLLASQLERFEFFEEAISVYQKILQVYLSLDYTLDKRAFR